MRDEIIEATTSASNTSFSAVDVWYLAVINSLLRSLTDVAMAYYDFLRQFDSDNDVIVSCFGDMMQIVRIMTADRMSAKGRGIAGKKQRLCHGLFFTVNQVIKLCDTINNQSALDFISTVRLIPFHFI